MLKNELSDDSLHVNVKGYAVIALLAEQARKTALKQKMALFASFIDRQFGWRQRNFQGENYLGTRVSTLNRELWARGSASAYPKAVDDRLSS